MATRALLVAALGLLATAAEHKPIALPVTRSVHRRAPLQKRQNAYGATLDNDIQMQAVYAVEAAVGSPAQKITLQLDTGSSDVWVFSPDGCQEVNPGSDCGGTFDSSASSSAHSASDLAQYPFEIMYGDGSSVKGRYFTDNFSVGGADVTDLIMGYAQSGVQPVYVGICGVGFSQNQAIVGEFGVDPHPSLLDTMVQENLIAAKAFSLYLNDINAKSGQIIFGGYDTSRWTGDIWAIPIVEDATSGQLDSYSVVLSSIGVTDPSGSDTLSTVDLPASVVLDSGTPLSRLPQSVFDQLFTYFGAVSDENENILVDCDVANRDGTLDFGFAGSSGPVFSVPYSQFILPNGDGTCLLAFLPASDGTLILGDTFMTSTYLVYDLTNQAIGMASTVFDSSDSDFQPFTAQGVYDIPNVKKVDDTDISVVAQSSAAAPQGTPGASPTEPALSGLANSTPTQYANQEEPTYANGQSAPSGGSGSGGGSHDGAAGMVRAWDSMAVGVLSLVALGAAFFMA